MVSSTCCSNTGTCLDCGGPRDYHTLNRGGAYKWLGAQQSYCCSIIECTKALIFTAQAATIHNQLANGPVRVLRMCIISVYMEYLLCM